MAIADYTDLFHQAAAQYNLPPGLLQAVATVESNGDPDAVSPAGAQGLMQIMPATAQSMGIDAKDPEQAIPAAAHILRQNLDRYNNDPQDALMAYNAGPNESHWSNAETQAYPRKVFNHWKEYQVAQNDNNSDVDPVEKALLDRANGTGEFAPNAAQPPASAAAPQTNDNSDVDPIEKALLDRANGTGEFAPDKMKAAAPAASAPEPGPELLQQIGRFGGDVATAAGNAAWKGVQDLGANMTPLKMAGIVPSMAVAPAASALAEGGAALPYVGPAVNAGLNALSKTPYVGKALQYVAGNAPEEAGFLENMLYRGTSGAAQGAIANKLMGGSAGQGAATGAVLNPALGVAGKIASPVFDAITGYGGNVSPETAKLAQAAADQYNIKIPGGLLNNNPFVNKAYSILDRLGMTPADENVANFTKAASQTFGSNTSKLTRETMDNAEDRIGDMFDKVWKETPELKISDNTLNKLAQIRDEATTIMPNDTRIPKQIDNLMDIAAKNNGAIPSADAKYLTSTKSPLHKMTRLGPDPVADYASDLKNTLYDALGESAPEDTLATYAKAKNFYKNFKTIESAKPDPVTGELSPTSVANAVSKTARKFGTNGLTDLQNLGDIGRQFSLSPSSGTAENTILGKVGEMLGQSGLHLLGQGAVGAGGYALGGLPAAIASYATGRGVGQYLASDMYRNHLINAALNQTPLLNLLSYSPAISNAIISGRQATAP